MHSPIHFIVVDDNRTNNLLCKFVLRKFSQGADIKIFTHPKTALEEIELEYGSNDGNKPTVLFLDINMPLISGWDFLNEFKGFSNEIKKQFVIYMLTSSVDDRDRERAASNPLVSGYIIKPLTIKLVEENLSIPLWLPKVTELPSGKVFA